MRTYHGVANQLAAAIAASTPHAPSAQRNHPNRFPNVHSAKTPVYEAIEVFVRLPHVVLLSSQHALPRGSGAPARRRPCAPAGRLRTAARLTIPIQVSKGDLGADAAPTGARARCGLQRTGTMLMLSVSGSNTMRASPRSSWRRTSATLSSKLRSWAP